MKLIIGLGNPGEEYQLTRHNAGFMALYKLEEVWNFPEFNSQKKFDSIISEGLISGEKTILVKPQTFMNESGTAVRRLMEFYKLTPSDILVIHDDLDIEQGKYKVANNSSAAGHHGVEDIIEKLGTQEFKRVRIGIAKPPEEKAACLLSGKDYVLQKFSEEELAELQKTIQKIIEVELK